MTSYNNKMFQTVAKLETFIRTSGQTLLKVLSTTLGRAYHIKIRLITHTYIYGTTDVKVCMCVCVCDDSN